MSEENIFESPTADLNKESLSDSKFEYTGPKSVPAGSSMAWIGESFRLFSASPGQWILCMILLFVISLVLNMIPIVGSIVGGLLTYVWVGGIIMGCKDLDDGQNFSVDTLFKCFRYKLAPLVGLSVLLYIISIAISFVALGPAFMTMLSGNEEAISGMDYTQVFSYGLFGFLLFIPLMMATWLATPLIVLEDKPVFEALKLSFVGSLKSLVACILYGIAIIALLILGAIPLLLGLLIVVPMLYGSCYAAYKDIFLTPKAIDWTEGQ